MDKGLLLINEFSKLTGLSKKALYLYNKQNLLSPAFVHSETDYRYYHQNQLLTATDSAVETSWFWVERDQAGIR